jgi:hypothetical protein
MRREYVISLFGSYICGKSPKGGEIAQKGAILHHFLKVSQLFIS